MPIYEYRCNKCAKKVSILVRTLSEPDPATCQYCGSSGLQRVISNFTVVRTWGESLNWMPDSDVMNDVDENDSSSVARWMGRMKNEMGEVTPEYNEMMGMMAAGDGPSTESNSSDESGI